MKIKAGDKILNLSAPWSGKVRYFKVMCGTRYAYIDLPSKVPTYVAVKNIKYNDELGVWEVIDEG